MSQEESRQKIAFIANLNAAKAIHAKTFVRAINDVLESNPAMTKNILPLWLNDHATEKGGQAAAQEAIRQHVKCVVGHYASAAAQGALDVYARHHDMPVFLPAATADHLPDLHPQAYRLCAPDHALADALVKHLQFQQKPTLYLQGDNSLHAAQLGKAISDQAKITGIKRITEEKEPPTSGSAHCYIGSFENSLRFLEVHQDLEGDIFLTDDAVHLDLPIHCPPSLQSRLNVIGFSPSEKYLKNTVVLDRYVKRWSKAPGTYYAQTYAATELALYIANNPNAIDTSPITTCLGPLSLTRQELGLTEYSLWRIEDGQLVAHPLSNQQTQKQPQGATS